MPPPTTIAVVIPYYNRSRVIGRAVDGVLRQTQRPDEIIIVDDGSRPEEAAALEAFRDSCTILHQTNAGSAVARNAGVSHATSQWIAFLDDDDEWTPNRLQVLSAYIAQHPECSAVHNAVHLAGTEVVYRKSELTLQDLLHATPCPALTSSVMVRRGALMLAGLMNPAMRQSQDHECFIRVAMHHRFHYVDQPLTIRHVHESNISINLNGESDAVNRMLFLYQHLYPSRDDYVRFMREVNVDLASRSVYDRNWTCLGNSLRWARAQGTGAIHLGFLTLVRLIGNRIRNKRST